MPCRSTRKKPFIFLAEAAHAGDLTAQFNFGLILSIGFYVEKNITAANDWLRHSASKGYRDSNVLLGLNLSYLYSQNEEKQRLTDDEFEYITSHLKFAEELKNTKGLVALASLHFLEKRNINEARRLLNLAIDLGDNKAFDFLKELESQLSKEATANLVQ